MRPISARSKSVRILGGMIAAGLALSVLAGGAQAAPGKNGKSKHEKHQKHQKQAKKVKPSVTKMGFKLDNDDVTTGDTISGSIKVLTGKGNSRVALPGAELKVTVDGVESGSLVTGEDGTATLSLIAEEGEHVVKVLYAGDSDHKSARRAQGYEGMPVMEEAPLPDEGGDEGTGEVPVDEVVIDEGGDVTG